MLSSRKWCDLVFEGRNKEYGAYKLRQHAGRRYRFALLSVTLVTLVVVLLPLVLKVGVLVRLYKDSRGFQQEVKFMKKLDEKDDFVRKRLSTGRAAPSVSTTKDATETPPEITEDPLAQASTYGVKGDETYQVTETELPPDADPEHNRDRKDLPIEGPQLSPVDVVEEMPQFPGGWHAFMKWLDDNVDYPEAVRRRHVEGDLNVSFVVEKDGTVCDVALEHKLDPVLDTAVRRALARMPRWTPGHKDGRVAAVKIIVPMHFQLE